MNPDSVRVDLSQDAIFFMVIPDLISDNGVEIAPCSFDQNPGILRAENMQIEEAMKRPQSVVVASVPDVNSAGPVWEHTNGREGLNGANVGSIDGIRGRVASFEEDSIIAVASVNGPAEKAPRK